MICKKCNAQNKEESKICAMCGEQLDTDNQQNQVNSQNISNESVPVQNTNNTQLEGQNINQSIEKGEEKNSKNKNIPIIIVISLLVLISLIVLFIVVNPSAISIFRSNTNKLSEKLSDGLSGKYDSVIANAEVTPKISNTGNKDLENIINKVNLKIEAKTDYKNKKLDYKVTANYNKNNLIDIDTIYKDKKMYLSLGNIYPKAIEYDDNSLSDVFNKAGDKNTKIVIEKTTKAFNKSLKKEYFKKSKEKIKLNGKTINSKVYTMKLTDTNIKKITESVQNILKNDDEYLEAASKVFNESKSKIKKSLNNIDKDASVLNGENISISIYTKGLFNKFVKLKMIYGEATYELSDLENNNYNIAVTEDKTTLSFNVKYSYEYNKTFKIDQPSDSIKYKELTPDVGTTIYNNLKNNKAYQELISDLGYDFGDLIEGYTRDTSLNYDSDYDLDYNY